MSGNSLFQCSRNQTALIRYSYKGTFMSLPFIPLTYSEVDTYLLFATIHTEVKLNSIFSLSFKTTPSSNSGPCYSKGHHYSEQNQQRSKEKMCF